MHAKKKDAEQGMYDVKETTDACVVASKIKAGLGLLISGF